MTDTPRWSVAQCKEEGHKIYTCSKKSDDYARSTGLLLIEAQKHISMTFRKFLQTCCVEPGRPALKKTRAYELIAIAGGKKTVEQVRERSTASSQKTRKRQQAHDTSATRAAAAMSAGSGQKPAAATTAEIDKLLHDPVGDRKDAAKRKAAQDAEREQWNKDHPEIIADIKSGKYAATESKTALANFKYACDTWLPKMNTTDLAIAVAYSRESGAQHANSKPQARAA